MNDAPKLLVEWSSPWREFVTSIGPALGRSPKRLAGEARTELFPYQGMLLSWALEVGFLLLLSVIPAKLARMRPYQPPVLPKYDVIYYSGDELPRVEDRGGARAGRSGRAGGQEGHHRTQTIRVARGESLREKIVDAPRLNLPQSDSAVANLLAYRAIPGPAPTEGLRSSQRSPELSEAAVPPAPEIQRDKMQAPPMLSTGVIPPSPALTQRDIASARIPGSSVVQVVPPPVSAPERISNSNARLTLPAPVVVAPPPTQVSRDLRSMGPGFESGELHKQVVPPPAQLSGTASNRHTVGGLGNPAVVAPPAQIGSAVSDRRAAGGLGNPKVVPPPVQLSGGSFERSAHQPVSGLGGGNAVVPPPPTFSASGSASGLGSGNRGAGLGGPMDAGALAAPPSNAGGSGRGSGIVVSSQPGSKVGAPGGGGAGSLAMSPTGGSKPGLGGSGGGSGIGHGTGPGSGLAGEGSGATKEGTGRGSDTVASNGISPYPGSGGAGSGTNGPPVMPGVSVHGGSNIITLPSFGAGGSQSNDPSRSSADLSHHGPAITVIGSSCSGGAFNLYCTLKGDKVYSIYIETRLGMAVLEYADPTSATHPYAEDLTAPQPVRADLPANLKRSRLIIACILDRSGSLKNAKVLEAGPADMTTKVLASLPDWKFSPAMRADQPVEVNAILGFNIDTR
jgi:hypothetical protein